MAQCFIIDNNLPRLLEICRLPSFPLSELADSGILVIEPNLTAFSIFDICESDYTPTDRVIAMVCPAPFDAWSGTEIPLDVSHGFEEGAFRRLVQEFLLDSERLVTDPATGLDAYEIPLSLLLGEYYPETSSTPPRTYLFELEYDIDHHPHDSPYPWEREPERQILQLTLTWELDIMTGACRAKPEELVPKSKAGRTLDPSELRTTGRWSKSQ